MLNLMRKHAGSWMIKVVLFAIVVVFVFWGVGSMRSQRATQVASVNGEIISLELYRQTYYRLMDNYRRIYGSQLSDDLLKILKPNEMALNQLVDRMLQVQEAQKLNVEVGHEELAETIYAVPAFQVNGAFNKERYYQVLSQNNLSDEGFRTQRSEQLMLDKLQSIVLSGVAVSEDEAREWYNWSDAEVSVEYALFTPERYKDIQPTDEQVKTFFDDHKDNFRTQPQVKSAYIHFDPDMYKTNIMIADDNVAQYFNGHQDEFRKEKRVKARHILIKLDEGADDAVSESKKAEATKIYEMAKSGKDFAELAKQFSEGPSKDQGGDLGWFTRSRMVKAFADKAFSMEAMEIGEPVQTNFGWHVIQVEQIEEATTQSLEEAEQGIRAKLVAEAAKAKALEKAEALYESVFDGDDLVEAGKALEVPVRETDFFTAAGPKQKDVVQAQKFAQVAFGLDKMAVSEIQEFTNGYIILQVTERKEAAIPEFDQVTARVKADTIKDQQKQRAKADADAFLEEVAKGGNFEQVGAQYGVEPKVTPQFGRNGAIPDIGTEQQFSQAAFGLTSEKPLAENAIQGRKGWYAIRLKERRVPDDAGFSKEEDAIVTRLTEQKRQTTMQTWLADLRSRSEIEVNESLIQP